MKDTNAVKILQYQMAEAVKSITGNTPHVELVPADSLPRATGGESKTASARVEDRRKNKLPS